MKAQFRYSEASVMRERGMYERSEEGCGGRCELRLRGEGGISQEKGRKTGL